jgi:ABC-type Zn2+ transport system substrate-binding protein/surface adhesin
MSLSKHLYFFDNVTELAHLMRVSDNALAAAKQIYDLAEFSVENEVQYLSNLEDFVSFRYLRDPSNYVLANLKNVSNDSTVLFHGNEFVFDKTNSVLISNSGTIIPQKNVSEVAITRV